jgi:hypothetical protein
MAEAWRVVNQKQTMMQTSGGQWVEAMKVDFQTTAGVEGSVVIPLNQYGAPAVKALIEARVSQIDEIASL